MPTVGDAGDSSQQLALLFGSLPETERSATILFYLYVFTPVELAEVLEIKPDDLGTLLTRGRALLQKKGEGRMQNAECKSPEGRSPVGTL